MEYKLAASRLQRFSTHNAPRSVSARFNSIFSSLVTCHSSLRVARKSGLLLFAFVALHLELRVLLWSKDRFRRLHVFGLAGIGATRLLMLRHGRVHLCLLISCQVQTRQ